ncbi:MAG: class I SAM-dependent methyltransferase [Polyangiales bacterium]|nr:class I SAM-dependent methyltransferase [Myxococcales bacterium]MCB9658041.1 class I SAM-dependent methyltransferase [Sandaracinaceae bacterium]
MSYQAQNKRMWDERVPIHVASEFYDVAGWRGGRCSLQPFEADELGSVEGKQLVHLQCHFGLDTLSWARRGALVTGLDFSQPAVDAALALAREAGLDARFVCADVFDAPAALGRRYDIVYTGIGALIWLHDIRRWASVVRSLLKPGGCLYLVECHPLTDVFDAGDLTVRHDYFHDPNGQVWDEPGTYADQGAETVANVSVEFRHPISDVLSALLSEGLQLELFHEFDHTAFARWPFMRRDADGCFRPPTGTPRLPLLYSLRARLPE